MIEHVDVDDKQKKNMMVVKKQCGTNRDVVII